MTGGCQGCASPQLTLRQGFGRMVRRRVPDVVEIVDVTDHSRGQMPYYRPGSANAAREDSGVPFASQHLRRPSRRS
jgi:hypothetical protein